MTDGLQEPEGAAGVADHVAELLALSATGDLDAFGRLYDELGPRVYGLIQRVVVDPAESERVLREVFLEVWQSARLVAAGHDHARGWIFAIAHRRAVDRARSIRAPQEVGLSSAAGGRAHRGHEGDASVADRRVARALAALPDARREAVALAYYGGRSQSEIAAMTGASIERIKKRMRDGLSRLTEELESSE